MAEGRRLYRSDNAVVAGVCGGIAEYFDIDPVIVRLVASLLIISSLGSALLVYLVLLLTTPTCPQDYSCPVDVDPVEQERRCCERGPRPPASVFVNDPREGRRTERVAYANEASFHIDDVTTVEDAHVTSDAFSTSSFTRDPLSSGYYEGFDAKAHEEPRSYVAVLDHDCCHARERRRRWIVATVIILLATLWLGIIANYLLPMISPWEVWPIAGVSMGIAIVLFAGRGSREYRRIWVLVGLFLILASVVGAVATIPSSGSLVHSYVHLWPLLVIASGLAMMGLSAHSISVGYATIGCLVLALACGAVGQATGFVPGDRTALKTQSYVSVGDLPRASLTSSGDGTFNLNAFCSDAVFDDAVYGTGDIDEACLDKGFTLTATASTVYADLEGVDYDSGNINSVASRITVNAVDAVESDVDIDIDADMSKVTVEIDPSLPVVIRKSGMVSSEIPGELMYDQALDAWVTPGYRLVGEGDIPVLTITMDGMFSDATIVCSGS